MSNFNKSRHYRGENIKKTKKKSIIEMYTNAKSSCIDVGQFLCNLKRASWYIKLYKLFK